MSTVTASPGEIRPGIFYTLNEFKSRMGWSKHAMRTARRQGLRVRRMGNRAYVHADDFFAYLRKLDGEDDDC